MPAAAVVPRALSPASGEVLPLLDLVRDVVERATHGVIGVIGSPGSGKTTALRLLEEHLPDVCCIDDARWDHELDGSGVRIYAATSALRRDHLATFRLAPWGLDEAIEYLLAHDPKRCASVVERIDDAAFAMGRPALWARILDRLAASSALPDVRAAVLVDTQGLERFPSVRTLLQAAGFVDALRAHPQAALREAPTQRLVAEAVRALESCDAPLLRAHLHDECAPMAASLLHAGGHAVAAPAGAHLENALLSGVAWGGVNLKLAHLRRAHFEDASLVQADLGYADATHAHFDRADARGADLHWTLASSASFLKTRLDRVHAPHADFRRATLRGATLRGALLRRAEFQWADLRDASFERANLVGAYLRRARIEGADFARADLSHAHLTGLWFRRTNLSGALLRRVHAEACDFSGVALPGAQMHGARLARSLFTGAQMPNADLSRARLTGVRAGDVNWEGADLSYADLGLVDFHMGSSRSGKLDSPLASEGSRTGFYTDEYHEMHFKAPEEIRHANLRGADLRGANLEGTDFYLVDVRDARYTKRQAAHLARCGAILRSKTS